MLFCVGFGCAYLCWAAFEGQVEHLADHQLHQHAAFLRSWALLPGPLAPQRVHFALFALYEALVCAVVTRLLWFAFRNLESYFSVSLLLAMFISGSIFSSGAIVFYGLGGRF